MKGVKSPPPLKPLGRWKTGVEPRKVKNPSKPLKLIRDWAEIEFDRDEVKVLIMAHDGNLTQCAKRLNCDPARLRAYVQGMPELQRAIAETMEQGVDLAVDILYQGLKDERFQNRFAAAKEFIRSDMGRKRGFGRPDIPNPQLEIRAQGQMAGNVIALKWLEPAKELEINPPKEPNKDPSSNAP